MKNNRKNAVKFHELPWDTNYFGVTCAKAILLEPLLLSDWNDLKPKFKNYQLISIENRNSEPVNAQLIGKDTSAFLVDVNIQFKKKFEKEVEKELTMQYESIWKIELHQALEKNNQIIELAEFQYSKFTEDPELAKRGGNQIYNQWLINSFEKQEKQFALSKDENDQVNGFLLYSYSENTCVIELIAVSKHIAHSSVGTSLFKAVEDAAYRNGCDEIRVGTQARNLGAINFYHKVGCKQVGSHQIYHLWNL